MEAVVVVNLILVERLVDRNVFIVLHRGVRVQIRRLQIVMSCLQLRVRMQGIGVDRIGMCSLVSSALLAGLGMLPLLLSLVLLLVILVVGAD